MSGPATTTNYWREHFDEAAARLPREFMRQVGKTVGGVAVDDGQVAMWQQCIAIALDLGNSDRVADLCCGNGLLTRSVSDACAAVIAVDFSEGLIDVARKHQAAPNIEYRVGDVAELGPEFFRQVSKVYMYESVQHLSAEQFRKLLEAIRDAGTVRRFFIGGVPDRERFHVFYDTPEKLAFEAERQKAGQPHIGTWWRRDEMLRVVGAAGMRGNVVDQHADLYSSRFRFDCVVTI